MNLKEEAAKLQKKWKEEKRWKGVKRLYSAEDVVRMRNSIRVEHTLAERGANKLFQLLEKESFVPALGALTGGQAVQMAQAGLKAIYASGWQVAADMNDALETYPDQSLYPTTSMPRLIERFNNAFMRADHVQRLQGKADLDYFLPIVADAEAGFGGPLNTFELIKAMIKAGAAAIHLEDQLSSLKKCGHLGGKVLVPGYLFIEKLMAARFAADVLDVPTLLIARTDALSAKLIRSDFDEVDRPFLTGNVSPEGYYELKGGLPYAIQRGLDFAPYADLVWCETWEPNIEEAKAFAAAIHEKFPGKWLAYNCSPSFNWKAKLNSKQIASFQQELGKAGYKFQFVTLAGFHSINAGMFELALDYKNRGMAAYSEFQEHEFDLQDKWGYSAIKHQSFVGTGYFDAIQTILTEGRASTTALNDSTESEGF